MKIRKHLSASGLYKLVRTGLYKIEDQRTEHAGIILQDALMSGLALFSLKDPSLLAFDARREEPKNLQTVYGIEQIPSDTYMRTILDDIAPESLRPVYKNVFRQLQRGKVLEQYLFINTFANFVTAPKQTIWWKESVKN